MVVANGQELQCKFRCEKFAWKTHGQTFTSNVYIFPLDNYGLIRGAQCLHASFIKLFMLIERVVWF